MDGLDHALFCCLSGQRSVFSPIRWEQENYIILLGVSTSTRLVSIFSLRSVIKVILAVLVSGATAVILWLPSYSQLGTIALARNLSWILPFAYIITFLGMEDGKWFLVKLGGFFGIKFDKRDDLTVRSQKQLLMEYEVLNGTVGRRESSLLVAGSIFVTAALVLLGQSTQVMERSSKEAIVFTSWAVYAIWLFLFQLTAARITDWTFERLRDIEKKLGIKVHRYLVRKRDPVRRWVWLWLLNGLLIAGSLVLGLDLEVFNIVLPIEVFLMAVPSFRNREEESEDMTNGWLG
jgi:hypothetical protein